MKLKPLSTEAPKTTTLETSVAECANEFMNAATSLHKLHLKVKGTGSYAQHKALQGYDEFHNFADSLVEEFQGASEKLIVIKDTAPKTLNSIQEAIDYLNELKDCVTDLQAKMPYSEINNLLDNSKSKINSMKYKLIFLS